MTPTEYFAKQVKAYRTARPWTQPQLAEQCQKAGLDWDRSIVANVEGGRRSSVTIHEVLTLAYVLGVPPALLLFPVMTGEPVEIAEGVALQPGLALRWFVGEDDLMGGRHPEYEREARPLLLYGELGRAHNAAGNAILNVRAQESVHGVDSPQAVDARERYAAVLGTLVQTLQRMDDLKMRPPAVAKVIHEDAKRFGLTVPKSVPVRAED